METPTRQMRPLPRSNFSLSPHCFIHREPGRIYTSDLLCALIVFIKHFSTFYRRADQMQARIAKVLSGTLYAALFF